VCVRDRRERKIECGFSSFGHHYKAYYFNILIFLLVIPSSRIGGWWLVAGVWCLSVAGDLVVGQPPANKNIFFFVTSEHRMQKDHGVFAHTKLGFWGIGHLHNTFIIRNKN
jgi:hypothetical protein